MSNTKYIDPPYSDEPYGQTVIDHIESYRQKGYKIRFYVGEFDFFNTDIKDIADVPGDFITSLKHKAHQMILMVSRVGDMENKRGPINEEPHKQEYITL